MSVRGQAGNRGKVCRHALEGLLQSATLTTVCQPLMTKTNSVIYQMIKSCNMIVLEEWYLSLMILIGSILIYHFQKLL